VRLAYLGYGATGCRGGGSERRFPFSAFGFPEKPHLRRRAGSHNWIGAGVCFLM